MSPTPEQNARVAIDSALEAVGWIVQDRAAMNLAAAPGVAVRDGIGNSIDVVEV